MEQKIVLIPAFNPNTLFIEWMKKLLEHPFLQIIIVNDGSSEGHHDVFMKLSTLERVTILNHAKNEGKGVAVRTGLHYIMNTFKYFGGVLIAGADGQHEVEDIERICNSTRIFKEGIIIGVRDFKSEFMPRYSHINNKIVSVIFDVLFKRKLLDVQSGLRYFPRQYISWIKGVNGNSYDFDSNVLIEAVKREVAIYEVPIGKAKMTQNVFLQYDGVYHPKLLSKYLFKALKRTR